MLKMNSLVSTLIDSILDITNFKIYFKVLLLTSMRILLNKNYKINLYFKINYKDAMNFHIYKILHMINLVSDSILK